MKRNEALALMRADFCKKYRPEYREVGYDFEVDLDRLVYAAFAAAQEPYVRELELFRATALDIGGHRYLGTLDTI